MASAMSVMMRASYERMLARDAQLTATDFADYDWVMIAPDEGGLLVYRNALLERDPEDDLYVWVFTEHQGNHVFALDECHGVYKLKAELTLYPHDVGGR